MNRRSFLRLLDISPLIPSVLMAKEKLTLHEQLMRAMSKPSTVEQRREWKNYYAHYDFKTKIQTVIENGVVIRSCRFEEYPYLFFGETQKKIDSGEVKYVIQKKRIFV